MRRLYALVVAAVLSGFTLLLLTGNYVADGPVVARVTEEHGVHGGDVFVVAGWATGMFALVALSRRRRTGDPG